jgi:uncharacterized protein (DUF2336 family)
MIVEKTIIDDLEQAIANKDIGLRADTLRRVTDLFVAGSDYSEEQIAVFDSVMNLLAREIEPSARARFGVRIAPLPNAPREIIRALADDEAIAVAGPVLSRSDRVDDATLLEAVQTKSQDHLLAISRRRILREPLTDVLVVRGNRNVARSTVENPGAKFSEYGFSMLIKRSENDEQLALLVWLRPEIPRHYALKLFNEASETVRRRLEITAQAKPEVVREMVAQASAEIQVEARDRHTQHKEARSAVQALFEAGKLTIPQLDTFAKEGKFDETTIALSILADLPVALVERVIMQDRAEQILVLAQAIGLPWSTTKALLVMQAHSNGLSPEDAESWHAQFTKLQPSTARKALQFYRLRERASSTARVASN